VRDTNPKNGSYKEVTTDSHGNKTDEKTHSKLAKGFIDTEHTHPSGGAEKTNRTVHVDDGHGGYREIKSDSDGNRSTAVFDSATNKTHTESTDNAYHRTVRDDNNKDGTYTEKTTDGWGSEIRSESGDQNHNKTVRDTDPKTKAYKETTTDSNNNPIAGSNQDADGSKGSWKINTDGSHSYMTEAHGHRSENTFQGGHLTQSVDTDTKSGVVKTAVHKDGQVITTTHTPGQAQDTVETAPEVATAGAAS
jgi:hypothetical protein